MTADEYNQQQLEQQEYEETMGTVSIGNAPASGHEMVEKVVVQGDLAALSPKERLDYYNQVCKSVGLNPLTRPFEYIRLNNKLTLYAKRDATDQIRTIRGISIEIVSREKLDELYIVTARATETSTGRKDESVGAVNLQGIKGEAAANAIMKAETKAKRRVTLSIAGLGFLDESEVASIPGATTVAVNTATGEIVSANITDDHIDTDKVLKASVWFREMIDADRIEENYKKIQNAWSKLNTNEQMEVHKQLGEKSPGSKKLYRNLLKEYLSYTLAQEAQLDEDQEESMRNVAG